jgi:hypothetical protein
VFGKAIIDDELRFPKAAADFSARGLPITVTLSAWQGKT